MRYLILLCFLGLHGCGQADSPAPNAPAEKQTLPLVLTVNYPLAWAAEQLVSDAAEVVFPAPADVDPAFWEPDLDTIAAYQQADLILLNGAGYAKWAARASLPQNRQVDTSAAVTDQYITVQTGPVHSHGPEGEHSHGELAFTTWLDLNLYQAQVDAIAEALAGLLPDEAAAIGERRAALNAELAALDSELQAIGERLAGAPLLYSHPVYQYLQRRYALNGIALHWEPDQIPTDADWAELEQILSSHPAQLMLWEGEPAEKTLEQLEQRGITIVVFAPMGNTPETGDFLANLRLSTNTLSGRSDRDGG